MISVVTQNDFDTRGAWHPRTNLHAPQLAGGRSLGERGGSKKHFMEGLLITFRFLQRRAQSPASYFPRCRAFYFGAPLNDRKATMRVAIRPRLATPLDDRFAVAEG
jgi:hypothetical protein